MMSQHLSSWANIFVTEGKIQEFGLTSQKAENYKPPNGGKCCRGANEKMPTVSKTAPNSGTLNILEPGQGFGDHYPKPYKS